MTYQIKDWNEYFENATSRTRKQCLWVPMPNKQSGLGLSRILSEPDGAAIFGIWCLVVEACSRQTAPRDGWLTDTGRAPDEQRACTPWVPADLALMFRRPVDEIERALAVLSSKPVGWIEVCADYTPTMREVHADRARGVPLGSEGKEGIEGRKYPVEAASTAPAREVFDYWVKVMGKSAQTKFPSTSKRYINVTKRLKEGFSVEQLCQAVDGCKATPSNMGDNDRGEAYNDLELICRTVEHVERFMRNAKQPPKPKPKVTAESTDQRRLREQQEREAANAEPYVEPTPEEIAAGKAQLAKVKEMARLARERANGQGEVGGE